MNFAKRRKRQKLFRKQYHETAKNLPPVSVGDKIFFQSPERKEWSKGEIIKKIGSRTYIIRAANGRTYKRNRAHIRRHLRQKLNKTTYDDHTCIPFFTNDNSLDDLLLQPIVHRPMKRTHANDQHEPAGYQKN